MSKVEAYFAKPAPMVLRRAAGYVAQVSKAYAHTTLALVLVIAGPVLPIAHCQLPTADWGGCRVGGYWNDG